MVELRNVMGSNPFYDSQNTHNYWLNDTWVKTIGVIRISFLQLGLNQARHSLLACVRTKLFSFLLQKQQQIYRTKNQEIILNSN